MKRSGFTLTDTQSLEAEQLTPRNTDFNLSAETIVPIFLIGTLFYWVNWYNHYLRLVLRTIEWIIKSSKRIKTAPNQLRRNNTVKFYLQHICIYSHLCQSATSLADHQPAARLKNNDHWEDPFLLGTTERQVWLLWTAAFANNESISHNGAIDARRIGEVKRDDLC